MFYDKSKNIGSLVMFLIGSQASKSNFIEKLEKEKKGF